MFLLNSRQVTEAEAQKFIKDFKLHLFMETSAKTGFNAQQLFIEAAKILYIDFLKYNRNVSYVMLFINIIIIHIHIVYSFL